MKEMIMSLFKMTSFVIPAAILLKGITLVDQIFISNISDNFLFSHSFISYLPLIIAPVGRALGMPLLVILNKEKEKYIVNSYVLSGVISSLLFSSIIFLSIFLFKDNFIKITGLTNDVNIEKYYLLQLISACLMLCSSFTNFIFLSQREGRVLFKSYLYTFTINLVGNFIAFQMLDTTDVIVSFGYATVCASVFQYIYQIRKVFKLFPPRLKDGFFIYLKRCKSIASSHFVITTIESLLPLFLSSIIQSQISDSDATNFNLTNRIFHFLYIPLISLRTVGSAWLSQQNEEEGFQSTKAFYSLLFIYSLLPLSIVFMLPNQIYAMLTGLGTTQNIFLSKILLLQVPILALFIYPSIKFDYEEKSWINSLSSLLNIFITFLLIFIYWGQISYIDIIIFYLAPRLLIYFCIHNLVFRRKTFFSTTVFTIFLLIFSVPNLLKAEQTMQVRSLNIGYLGKKMSSVPYEAASIIQYLITSPSHKTLVKQGLNGRILSNIAQSWEISDNFSKYTFELKTTLTFNNGMTLNCEKAKKSFLFLKTKIQKSLEDIKSITCKGERLVFYLNKSSTTFLTQLTSIKLSVLDVNESKVSGLGDYKISNMSPIKLSLIHEKKQTPKEIIFRNYESRKSLLKDFDKNIINFIPTIPWGTDLIKYRSELVESKLFNRLHLMAFGNRLLQNKFQETRKCFNSLLDRQKIINKSSKVDLYHAAYGVNPPSMKGHMNMFLEKQSNCLVHKKQFHIITIRNRYPQKIKDIIRNVYLKHKIKIVYKELDIFQYLKRLKKGNFDIALFTFGITYRPIENFKNFYTKNDKLLVTHLSAKSSFKSLFSDSVLEIGTLLKSLQKIENKKSNIIPFLFEKNIGVLNGCLRFKERIDATSSNVDAYKVTQKKDCKL